jgi:hypothetical protein
MMRGGAIIRVLLAGRLRLRLWTAIAACAVAAACGQTGSPGAPGSLAKPVLVAVGEFDSVPDTVLADPGFAARISQRMSGLTDYSVRRETVKRAGATIRQQLVASLRAGGLPAEAADTDNARGDIVTLLVTGRLRSLDEAALRQRKLSPIGAGRSRIVADIKVVHAADGTTTKTLLTFEAEDTAGAAPARGGRQTEPAGGPAAPAAAPGAITAPLSPDIDAHMRRIASAAAERIFATAAEQGWTRPPSAARATR